MHMVSSWISKSFLYPKLCARISPEESNARVHVVSWGYLSVNTSRVKFAGQRNFTVGEELGETLGDTEGVKLGLEEADGRKLGAELGPSLGDAVGEVLGKLLVEGLSEGAALG